MRSQLPCGDMRAATKLVNTTTGFDSPRLHHFTLCSENDITRLTCSIVFGAKCVIVQIRIKQRRSPICVAAIRKASRQAVSWKLRFGVGAPSWDKRFHCTDLHSAAAKCTIEASTRAQGNIEHILFILIRIRLSNDQL